MSVNTPVIADYRYILSKVEGADPATKSVPFTVHHMAVSAIFNEEPLGNLKQAFTLEFFADGRLIEGFTPVAYKRVDQNGDNQLL